MDKTPLLCLIAIKNEFNQRYKCMDRFTLKDKLFKPKSINFKPLGLGKIWDCCLLIF